METNATIYGSGLDKLAYQADTVNVTGRGLTLNGNFIDLIRSDPEKGVFLVEGCADTDKPLVLEVWKGNKRLCAAVMPLQLSGVEGMFRWINVRGATGGTVTLTNRTGSPANYPDSLCNNNMVVFIHGFACAENDARADGAEVFTRLYATNFISIYRSMGGERRNDKREDQNYTFRVRTKRDEHGVITNAFYGKIYGPIWYGVKYVGCTYYLNPTSLDRNLEFDRTKNLLQGVVDKNQLPSEP